MAWAMRNRQMPLESCPSTNRKRMSCKDKIFPLHPAQRAGMTPRGVAAILRRGRWNPHAKGSGIERQKYWPLFQPQQQSWIAYFHPYFYVRKINTYIFRSLFVGFLLLAAEHVFIWHTFLPIFKSCSVSPDDGRHIIWGSYQIATIYFFELMVQHSPQVGLRTWGLGENVWI